MALFSFNRVHQYQKIEDASGNKDAVPKPTRRHNISETLSTPLPWILSTVVLAFMVLILAWNYLLVQRREHSYVKGFDTDFEPLRQLINLKKVTFGGTLKYTNSGHIYMDNGPDGIEYFGPPSPKIDQAWKDLIGSDYLMEISSDEAGMIDGKSDEHPIVGYRMIPDFIHSLHCVNHIRIILDSEYYFNASLSDLKRIDRIHIHHCLNHIRQLIECNVDLTPVTSIYMPSVDTFVGNFEQTHTCRDMKSMQAWIAERRAWEIGENHNGDRKARYSAAHPDKKAPGQGYELNEDALMPWNWTQSEYD